jgi:hypothetical protein
MGCAHRIDEMLAMAIPCEPQEIPRFARNHRPRRSGRHSDRSLTTKRPMRNRLSKASNLGRLVVRRREESLLIGVAFLDRQAGRDARANTSIES